MKDKKKIILLVISILLLMIVTVGVTFAVFTYTKLGTTENTVTTGTLKFLYTENTGIGNGINIENAFPVSDEVGKGYNTDKYVFDFSVEGTNSGTEEIPYEVTLRKKDTSSVNDKNIKVYLTDMTEDADTAIVEPTLYSSLMQTTIDVGEEVEKTLYNGTVLGGELTYLKDFRLRMWIDEKSNQDDINGKTFTALVNVYSNVPLVSQEELDLRNSTEISNFSVNGTDVEVVEGKSYDYEVSLPDGTTSITIDLEAKNPDAEIVSIEKIDDMAHANSNIKKMAVSKTFDLTEGDNFFRITIRSENAVNTDQYVLKVSIGLTGFARKILINNPVIEKTPTLTTSSNNSSDASGLYMSTDTNSGKPTYYFRGNVTNNYVTFAGLTWRIVRINEDGTIRMVLSSNMPAAGSEDYEEIYLYNSNKNYYYATTNVDSTAKTLLNQWYSKYIASNTNYSSKVATGDYYCQQAKVTVDINCMTFGKLYSAYKPDFKCGKDKNGYGVVNGSVGLLTYDEVVYAGGYYSMANSSYYLYYGNKYFWTMSPVGSSGSNYFGWRVKSDGTLESSLLTNSSYIRPVINIKPDITVTGNGKSGDYYVIQ